MNTFATIESSGLLKETYGDGVADALKRKREKLAETKLGLVSEHPTEEGKEDGS